MQHSALLHFVGSSQDFAELLCCYLSPRSLAALSATSRDLRAAVARLSEEVWQQTAGHSHPPGHPVLQAPCVRSYLRQQQITHVNIASQRCTVQKLVTSGDSGRLSPDFSKHADLGRYSSTAVRPCSLPTDPGGISLILDLVCRARSCS